MEHVVKHLATPNTIMIPSSALVTAVLVDMHSSDIAGIKLSEVTLFKCALTRQFDRFRWEPHYSPAELDNVPYKVLSRPFEVFNFDFTTAKSWSMADRLRKTQAFSSQIDIIADGKVNAVMFWYDTLISIFIQLGTTCPFMKTLSYPTPLAVMHGQNLGIK